MLFLSGKSRSEVIYLGEFNILENSRLVITVMFLKVKNICATSWSWFSMCFQQWVSGSVRKEK